MSLQLIAQSYLFNDSDIDSDAKVECKKDSVGEVGKDIEGLKGMPTKGPFSINEFQELAEKLWSLTLLIDEHATITREARKKETDAVEAGQDTKGDDQYKCPYCLKSFTMASVLIQHLKLHTHLMLDGRFHFNQRTGELVFIDVQTKNKKGRMVFKCSKCEKIFSRKWEARRHFRDHATGCNCKICNNCCVRK